MLKQPIGVFDSGIGGTSILWEIRKLMPNEDYIYLADSRNAPYGEKPREEIYNLSKKNTEFLLKNNVKIVVVACNTATTNSISILRETYKIPFIGIEPAIKPAALKSETKKIGILATKGTLTSELFHKTSSSFRQDIQVLEQVGEGLVPLIEAGKVNSDETYRLLQKYLEPMIEANIDHLVLGCSHYPYLIPVIKNILPTGVNIIDSGQAVARQTKNVLHSLDLLSVDKPTGDLQIYTNGKENILKSMFPEYAQEIEYLDF